MGKKTKTGKARKDKYYQLAKETGLRSRASFKLLQLNRKFQFLEKSRVCIDLCAAPGGWLQVAQQNMPSSSLIMGVDLVSIKPLHNVVTFQEDITTEKCRTTLRKELQTWKADVVLHDGAPNVGKNWLHDAFQQAQLTLMALKLATDFLRKGGWFVSKVFRSKDYHALIWVFKQLFKSVHATKPQASRNESAEIFVVCENYKAPDKIDPRFLDVKHVFKDVGLDSKPGLNLIHPEKTKKKPEGYDETDTSFHKKLPASKFISAENHFELLSDAHQIVLDTDEIKNHPLTTKEIKECCLDIKVLGKKDIRLMINWQKKIKKSIEGDTKESNMETEAPAESEDEETKIANKLSEMESEQAAELKRKRKKVMREKRKLRDAMALKMIHPGDNIETTDDIDLFNIKKIKSKHGLGDVERDEISDTESDSDDDLGPKKSVKITETYSRHKDEEDVEEDAEEDEEDDSDNEESDDSDEEEEIPEAEKNPLVVNLESKETQAKRKMDMWFSKDTFTGLEAEGDEDLEIETMAAEYKKKGGVILDDKSKKRGKKTESESESESESEDSDSGHVSDESMEVTADHSDSSDADSDTDSDSSDADSDYDVHASLQRTLVDRKKKKVPTATLR